MDDEREKGNGKREGDDCGGNDGGKGGQRGGSLLVLMNRYFRFRQQPMDVLKAGKMPCGGDG
jgi:hypothetical protein